MFSRQQFAIFVIIPTLFLSISSPWFSNNAHLIGVSAKGIADKFNEPRRILLLTAHPDDECMFFAPTLLQLTASAKDVYSLCLSTGNSEGLGDIREKELSRSLDILGVPESNRRVLHEPFYDNITVFWDTELIATHVNSYVQEKAIDTILTFDDMGISSHPNHISLIRGVTALLSEQTESHLRVFSLITVGVIPKYAGVLAVVAHRAKDGLCFLFNQSSFLGCNRVVVISGVREYANALSAMLQHRSQLVWFRWLYVSFSRYMWVNEWVDVSGPIQVVQAQ